jgi:hypothetical protein
MLCVMVKADEVSWNLGQKVSGAGSRPQPRVAQDQECMSAATTNATVEAVMIKAIPITHRWYRASAWASSQSATALRNCLLDSGLSATRGWGIPASPAAMHGRALDQKSPG